MRLTLDDRASGRGERGGQMARYETNDAVGPIGPRSALNELFADTSFLQGANAAYIEYLLAAFEANPASVSSDWRQFFTDMGHQAGTPTTLSSPGSKGLKSLSTEDPDLIVAFADDFNASSALTPITTTASEDVKRATRGFCTCVDDDPGLSHAGSFTCSSRSTGP